MGNSTLRSGTMRVWILGGDLAGHHVQVRLGKASYTYSVDGVQPHSGTIQIDSLDVPIRVARAASVDAPPPRAPMADL